jgi:tetratricopeptide (TPR) repeat protein
VEVSVKKLLVVSLVGAALAASLPVTAHDEAAVPGGKLGKISAFPTSCDPAVQPEFERAVAMLHSFWYNLAESTFTDILAKDPGCTVTAWGYAAILMSNPLAGAGASPAGAAKAQAAIDNARRNPPKTQRERDYVEAVAAYYEDWANRPEKARQAARSKAFEALAAKYPEDDEAQIFSALYIAGTQSQADQTFAAYQKAVAILEPEFRKYPDHPGVAHYLIHSYDAPPLAQKGLVAARRYADIAPDAPHALHMPSHIFTRVGSWDESIATNTRSAAVARTAADWPEAYHAADYAVYAYLQLSRDADARRMMEDAYKYSGGDTPSPAYPYAAAAMPARLALERGDWKAAARLEPLPSKMPFTQAITYFARALGAARSADVAAAKADAEQLAVLHKQLEAAKNTYWATEVEVQQLAAAGWIAHAQGMGDEGLKLMRAAADLEDRNEKHIVTPGRVVPARELLGEMLLEEKQPAEALKAFEASQVREPNRFRNYAGSARAAEMMGDKARAREYSAKLADLASKGDGDRPDLVRARALLSQR